MTTQKKPSIVTVGTFDGVHRGHDAVLTHLTSEGCRRGLRPVVVTFDRHPLQVVDPRRAPGLLLDMDKRDQLLRRDGIEVLRVEFTDAVRQLSCADWLRRLKEELEMQALVLGYDNTFGCDGVRMDADDYIALGRSLGIDVMVTPRVDGCSSSAARKAIAEGDVKKAAAILGRPFAIEGDVVHGSHVGRTIQVPTANIQVQPGLLLPAKGVYAAHAILPDGSQRKAVVNIGTNPTVSDTEKLRVEAHLLDYGADLYGCRLTLLFDDRLRDEQRFDSLQQLREALHRDIALRRKMQ